MGGPVTLEELQCAVRACWSAETSDDLESWDAQNPAAGQCGTTAFVVRGLLGGAVVVARIEGTEPLEHHAWNRLDSGLEIDLTRDQFPTAPRLTECDIPEAMLMDLFGRQADLLAARVRDRLASTV